VDQQAQVGQRERALSSLNAERRCLIHVDRFRTLRIQKVLEDANLKLASVLSSVVGKSGRAMLKAIVEGETNPEKLAELAQGNARKKRAELIEALRGRVTEHHRRLLKLHLGLIDTLQVAMKEVDDSVGKTLEPIQARAQLLTTMPGVSDIGASVIVAEIGVDMTRFPSPGHLVSWAGMCPRNDESAGKRRSTRLRKGGTWLKTTLVTCAWTAVRTKDSYLKAQFMRLKARRGAKKAIMAIAASMLTACFFMLRDEVPYKDLGAQHFDRHDTGKTIGRLVKRLEALGCEVDIKRAA
jgi:transposase